MSLDLPLNPEIRELFDVEDLAYGRWVTLREAIHSAREYYSRDKRGAVRWLNYIVITANGDLKLVQIGPRGGRRISWTFGPAPVGIAA